MLGRAMAVAFMLGTGWVQLWSQLWSGTWQAIALIASLLGLAAAYALKNTYMRYGLALGAAFLLALTNANWHAAALQQQQLPAHEENKPFKLLIQVDSLVRLQPDSRSFRASVLEARPNHVPKTITLTWGSPDWGGPYAQPKAYDFPLIKPGQVWQVTTFLKTPHGARNPNGFDYESYVFAQNVRAIGTIRGTPKLISGSPQRWSIALVAEMWRHKLRAAMLPYVENLRWGGVILALSIGDQASINAADWEVFNRTGLTHLVSISGTHVTLLASFSALLFALAWRRLKFAGKPVVEYVPAAVAAGSFALLIAGLYSLTAGWGVPARRTFTMFAVTVFTLLIRLPLSITQIIAAAAVSVLLFDPLAIISTGFWLSFGAVLVLVACAAWWGNELWAGGQSYRQKSWRKWRRASAWQLVISVALLPPLAFLFFELSLVSPLSNAYAIPIIGLLVTPLALLFALLSLLPFAWLAEAVLWVAHTLLLFMMQMTVWLSEQPLASLPAAKPPFWILLIALLGMVIALLPRAFPLSWLAWGLVIPALFWRNPSLPAGEWRLHALDVGQGSAVLVETASTVLLFDTGLRRGPDSDEGLRTIKPYLRSLGHTAIDTLVLSHADLDHVGGTRSVLQFFPVQQSYSSFDVEAYLEREARLLRGHAPEVTLPVAQNICRRGDSWEVDGVQFTFIWPSNTLDDASDKNANSCVLEIKGAYHRALITGDIGVKQEKQLIEAGLTRQEVVVVGHHGSKTSSGQLWVDQLQSQIAIAQVGWWSRYGHPHDEVQQRWQRSGAQFLRTDHHGGVIVHSRQIGLKTHVERISRRRYWQNNLGFKD